jgi:hypothetical protein
VGTFHHGKGDLHGITVVVDTPGAQVFVGRCDTVTPEGVVLLDGDVHDASGGTPKAEWIQKAARFGVWKRFDRHIVPAADVASIVRLGDVGR